jgi:galactoside 2-L-fucosyltransferase 1/2
MGGMCNTNYLDTSIRYFIDKFRGHCLLFVVCSDDMSWAQVNFPTLLSNVTVSDGHCKPEVTFSANLNAVQDMAILVMCNHTLMTVGTYGWWSAYLAGGVTVYCDKYPPGDNANLMISRRDMYPPKWIGFS